ncbi:uncharacterized protein K452DRAFT_245778 [Aplosporella prunicola CBS 121167]|uniref:SprT-like domain-containing protein n=1 Tax=Aplosporella prunicola CBS 121167 TaxID=1176127 RepID=A0A6A6BKZ5_9PEZI|nr:uncharacterized protein K452DRAFT_245778 [Aplosporella prunicola CBS 121167]KAF2144706.1 hypothetical protein K452DRAFT_245778 [Aplosporella prunicola CBS 121167]
MEVEALPRNFPQRIDGSVRQLFPPEKYKTNALIQRADSIANDNSQRLTSGSSTQERPSSSSSADDDAVLRYSPPRRKSPQKTLQPPVRPCTPPPSTSLSNSRLVSPSKKNRIPTPPHQQNTDAFWSQEVINSWNDEHSPQKPLFPRPKATTGTEPQPSSLSGKLSPTKKNPSAVQARKSFEKAKHQIAQDFLEELDEVISGGKISEMAADCGGVKLIWSKKLNSTAGRANWKRESVRVQESGATMMRFKHHASIELAEKVIDDEDRLVNVIAHEYCHLANFMISGVRDNPHGKEFKEWARKVTSKFSSRNITVTTKHSYEIDYKYVWTCVSCGHEFKRHSKSIDPNKHSCGGCKSKLIQTKPAVRQKDPTKGPSEYQLFVKENFQRIKRENSDKSHGTVMEIMGREYRNWKAEKEAVTTSNKLNDVTKALEIVVLD